MDRYVEQRDGGYYLAGGRIGLDAMVYRFNHYLGDHAIL